VICEDGTDWPCISDVFVKSRKNYETLRKFAKGSLRSKEDQAKDRKKAVLMRLG